MTQISQKEADQLREKLKTILSESQGGQNALIPLLQKVQEEFGYVPEEAISGISERTGVPASQVFGVLTFYAQFRLKPHGRNVINVCQGTACHVLGSAKILKALEDYLGIQMGETTDDREFTLDEVRCLGSCSLAPVMVINQDTYGRLTPEKALKLVKGYRKHADDN
ncbi:MAG: NADH-quinone oxidoreductase subunit NuoE [Anaerolineae bacterium]|nr:NADH-quinone oxidoreductase subunit NuoE [Anaerolineae bacterium]